MGPRALGILTAGLLAAACGPESPGTGATAPSSSPDAGTPPAPTAPPAEPTTREGLAALPLDPGCPGPKRRAEVVAYDEQSFVVAWLASCALGPAEVRVQRYDSAATPIWPVPAVLTSGQGTATDPSIAVAGGDIFVSWHQSEGFPSMWLARLDPDGRSVAFLDVRPACETATTSRRPPEPVERLELARPNAANGYAARGAIFASGDVIFAAYVQGDPTTEVLRVEALTLDGAGIPIASCAAATQGMRTIATGRAGHIAIDGGDLEGDDDRVQILEATIGTDSSTTTLPSTLVLTYPAIDGDGAAKLYAYSDAGPVSIAAGVAGKPAHLTTAADPAGARYHLFIEHQAGATAAWLRPADLSSATNAPALDGARAIAAIPGVEGGLRGWIAGPRPTGVQRFTWADPATGDVVVEPMSTVSSRTRIRAACLPGEPPLCVAVWTTTQGALEADVW